MKFVATASLIAAIGSASAQHHGHSHGHAHGHTHHHHHVATPPNVHIVTVYEFNGRLISANEVAEGVKNGTLIYDAASISLTEEASAEIHGILSPAGTKPEAAESNLVSATKGKHAPTALGSFSYDFSFDGEISTSDSVGGLDFEFPDGQIDCSTFPSEYGALAVGWLGLGGWIGIQSGGFTDVTTVTDSTCLNDNCCSSGDFCSYACPPGYQKSQWPSTQGNNGQSVGGILCKEGKLYLTNPSLSKCLCIKGTNKVTVQVSNTLDQNVAVCRTDYPGTEGQTVPLNAQPGSVSPLTCPDASSYYKWTGSSTSAQYYLNPAGVPVSSACQWGSPNEPWGNFAPVNLGVGYSNGAAWLSIFQNVPTTSSRLSYTVELVGDDGSYDNFIGRCKYINGQYCSGDDYTDCNYDKGCTVRVASGTATYVLS